MLEVVKKCMKQIQACC